jgi:hypothetical protein
VLSELPAEAALLVSQQAFIPGCIMMLADIAMPQEEGAGLGDFEAGAWELQQQDAQVEYQPAYANGFWRAQVNSGIAKSTSLFLAYDSLSDYEAQVAHGTLVQALAALLPEAASEGAPSAAVEAALAAPDPVVVASWGGQLQVLLQGAPQLPVNNSGGTVRVVLVQGEQVLLDQLHEVEQSEGGLRLRLPLPVSGGCALHAAAMALYLFAPNAEDDSIGSSKAFDNVTTSSSSVSLKGLSGSNGAKEGGSAGSRGSSSTQGAAPLAHLTVLLLPPAAADELMFWVEQQQLSHELLQPLLEDMAVAIEGATAAAGGAGAGGFVGNAATILSQSAEECQQARAFAERCALVECADLMAVCLPRILLMLHQVQPLAAGGVQLPAAAGAAREAAVDQQLAFGPTTREGTLEEAVMAPGAGLVAADDQTSKAKTKERPIVSALGATERMALPAAEAGPSVSPVKRVEKGKGCRDGQGVGSKQCAPAGQASSSCAVVGSETAAAAGGGCQGWVFLWWCAAGAFMGWSDQQLEAAYQASRLQRRPPTWIMMGCLDITTNVLMGGRALLHAFRVGKGGSAWAWGAWHISGEIFGILFGLWILFSPKRQWHFTGVVATLHSLIVSLLFWLVNIFVEQSDRSIMLAAFGKQPNLLYALTLFGAVRIVSLQLSPPWLLRHATVPAVTFSMIYYSDPSFWSVFLGVPVWLQIAAVCAAAVGVVVVQEAFSRAKYIRALASSTVRPIGSATGGHISRRDGK